MTNGSNFPRPIIVSGRRYFRLSEVVAWESGLVREASASALLARQVRRPGTNEIRRPGRLNSGTAGGSW